jgi:hypothetical protein
MDLIVDETCIALARDRQIMMASLLGVSHPGEYEKMDDVRVCGTRARVASCRVMVVSDTMGECGVIRRSCQCVM